MSGIEQVIENYIIDSFFDVLFAFVISLLFYCYYKLNVTVTVQRMQESYFNLREGDIQGIYVKLII